MDYKAELLALTDTEASVFAAVASCDKGGTLGYLIRELKDITGVGPRKLEAAVQTMLENEVLAMDGRLAIQQGFVLGATGNEYLKVLAEA